MIFTSLLKKNQGTSMLRKFNKLYYKFRWKSVLRNFHHVAWHWYKIKYSLSLFHALFTLKITLLAVKKRFLVPYVFSVYCYLMNSYSVWNCFKIFKSALWSYQWMYFPSLGLKQSDPRSISSTSEISPTSSGWNWNNSLRCWSLALTPISWDLHDTSSTTSYI